MARYRSIKRANERIEGLLWDGSRLFDAKIRAEGQEARLRAALAELVALKTLKDTEGRTADYEQRQPAAWQAAREALGGPAE